MAGHLAVIRALTRHAMMTGTSLPNGLVREMIAGAAGYVSTHQMLDAIARGGAATVLDPAVLVAAMGAWSVPITYQQAVACVRAGAPEIRPTTLADE